MAIAATPPSGIILRFSLLTEALKRGLIEGVRRRQPIARLGPLGPLIGVLLAYLTDTRRRLAALHARLAAGKLRGAPRRSTDARPAADRARAPRRPPGMAPGPVFQRFGMAYFAYELRDLLDDPEMRALLAATPQAGRLLRPLWRKLSPEPLPEVLRPPSSPRPVAPWADPPGLADQPLAPAAAPSPTWGHPAPPAAPRAPLPRWLPLLFQR